MRDALSELERYHRGRIVLLGASRAYRPVSGAAMTDLLTDADGRTHDDNIPPPLLRPEHFSALRAHAQRLLPPLFAEIVLRAENDMLQPMYDVESQQIAFGNICLLGDAAFTARPHVGIGVLKQVFISNQTEGS